ncbi:MAG: DUF6788 family protein [Nitrososphaerales archaeon]
MENKEFEREVKKMLKKIPASVVIKYINCGKPTCKSCPHGPYMYLVKREKGVVKTVYLGKADENFLLRKKQVFNKINSLLLEYEKEVKALQDKYLELIAQAVSQEEEGESLCQPGQLQTK